MSEGVRAAICGVAAVPLFTGLAMLKFDVGLLGWALLAVGFGIAAIAHIK